MQLTFPSELSELEAEVENLKDEFKEIEQLRERHLKYLHDNGEFSSEDLKFNLNQFEIDYNLLYVGLSMSFFVI